MLTLAEYQQAKKSGVRIDPDRVAWLKLLFVPPNRRDYDVDNCVAQIKSGIDGMADGLGMNDKMFRFDGPPLLSEELGGLVKVEIRQ